jgi:hypothetical protein
MLTPRTSGATVPMVGGENFRAVHTVGEESRCFRAIVIVVVVQAERRRRRRRSTPSAIFGFASRSQLMSTKICGVGMLALHVVSHRHLELVLETTRCKVTPRHASSTLVHKPIDDPRQVKSYVWSTDRLVDRCCEKLTNGDGSDQCRTSSSEV